jgi:hypothetical protein
MEAMDLAVEVAVITATSSSAPIDTVTSPVSVAIDAVYEMAMEPPSGSVTRPDVNATSGIGPVPEPAIGEGINMEYGIVTVSFEKKIELGTALMVARMLTSVNEDEFVGAMRTFDNTGEKSASRRGMALELAILIHK